MAENQDTPLQGVAVISCFDSQPDKLLKKIIGDAFDESNYHRRNLGFTVFNCYPWHLNTKYYEADIDFVLISYHETLQTNSNNFKDHIQAVIINFDNNHRDSFIQLNQWQPFLQIADPEVKMLVVETAKDDCVISRHSILTWCMDNGFELIEMQPDEISDDDQEENDFKETNGVERIMQALSAHPWPNMEMKELANYQPSSKFQDLLTQAKSPLSSCDNSISKSQTSLNTSETSEVDEAMRQLRIDVLLSEDKDLLNCFDESGEPSFSKLYDKFESFKKKADTLNGLERHLYAEKVVMAFCDVLGVDKDDVIEEYKNSTE